MQNDITPEVVVNWVSEIFRGSAEQNENGYVFSPRNGDSDERYELSTSQIENAIQILTSKSEFEETALYDDHSYEILVRQENLARFTPLSMRFREGSLVKRDDENKITYTISKPTDEYLLFLIYKLSKIAPLKYSFDNYLFRSARTRSRERIEISVFELLKSSSSRYLTLKIESERNKSVNDFIKFSNAFFFQVSYNLDLAIMPQRFLSDFVRTSRIEQLRRTSIDELEAPKRFYPRDLIYHYQLAVASDSPPLEYLSYYHVAEHFFDAAFNDDLIERVKDKITQPDFSYKRKKDIKGVIDLIGKSLKFRGENVVFSEQEALRLTFEKHIDTNVLLEKVKEYDANLIEFYRSNQVPFSDGDTVNLESGDSAQIISLLAKRIYKTRNAIVHSKDGDKVRYIPFEHDKLLVMEVPLARFIAELIILKNSNEIG
jgi:hypothetical protein